MKNNNKFLIEPKDMITFDLKILNKDNSDIKFKFKDKTITLGKEEIMEGLDESIIGNNLSTSKVFEIELNIKNDVKIFNENILSGLYVFGFKVHKIHKHSSREQLDMDDLSNMHDENKKIENLETKIENLTSKIEKLEAEKQLSEQLFKAKAEELAKNAVSKVEILKEEIKNKAKEEVEYKSKFAIQKLIEELLSPLNNLYSAVKAGSNVNDPNVAAYVKGFEMLTNQIFSTLETFGIKIIEPKSGDIFNPEQHQIHELILDESFKKDQIIKLISRGYSLHERVIRPAIVIVAK